MNKQNDQELQMNATIKLWYDEHSDETAQLALDLWNHAEPGMEEYYSCHRTAEFMEQHGFQTETFHILGNDRKPNCVVATWGSGHPVIGILGELDALPGLGQKAVPYRSPIEGACGHGCGHNLMNAMGSSAAVAVKEALQAENLSGTIRYYACPAEELGGGKMYMYQKGVFEGLDCVLSWHPQPGTNLKVKEVILNSIISAKIEFFGQDAHAAVAPETGRSALDACELMNVGVNYLREHMDPTSRVHYVYLNGGDRPNIVPKYAALEYNIRATDVASVTELFERVKKCAEGAALMTETTCKITVESVGLPPVQIDDFNRFLYRSVEKLPPLIYTEEEKAFARELFRNHTGRNPINDEEAMPSQREAPSGVHKNVPNSTDVGWVARKVPTARLMGLTMIGGTYMHSWACVACTGHSIGIHGACYVSMAIAQAAYDIFRDPSQIPAWWEDLRQQTASDILPAFEQQTIDTLS